MYKVICLYQGTTYVLHDPESDNLRLYDDEIETEDNQPGSFQFTVSYDHPYLDKIVGLASDIRVYDGNEEIFRGRPIDDGEDLYRMRTFKCEGELAFLYDSIQPRRELHDISPLQLFTLLLNEHNAQVENRGPIDKTFRVGAVTVTDPNDSLYRYTNRETTLDCIGDKLLNRLGGHLCVRISGGYRYLDLLKDVNTVGDQPIQLGENLLDYAKDTDYSQVATACIPLGERMEVTEIAALDAYVTIEMVNNGSDCIMLPAAVAQYGFICKVVNFDDISLPANLKTAGENWLQDGQYANMVLTLTAVDLHGLGYDYQPIRKNTKIRVLSTPHGMNRWFEVSKRTYHLTQPETDTVVFGTSEKKKSFTSSSKKQVEEAVQHTDQLRKDIDTVIAQERENISNILNQATHGYIVLDPVTGPERLLIMDTNSVDTATKIWKFDLNGLGYAKSDTPGTPLNQLTWGLAMTMDGRINADFITVGTLLASIIKAGILSDVNGLNFWNMETGEFRLASSTKIGTNANNKTIDDYVSDAADDAVSTYDGTLTQQELFNRLTNNGQTQGIYLNNGRLYINATYICTGTLSADIINGGTLSLGGANNTNGLLVLKNGSGTEVARMDNTGLTSKATSGSHTLKSTLDAGELKFKVDSNTTLDIAPLYDNSGNGYTGFSVYRPLFFVKGAGGDCLMRLAGYYGDNSSYNSGVYFGYAVKIASSLTVTGTKNREAETENYNKRLLYCYEMPSPMFGDIGTGQTDDNGECIVEIDDIFSETIRTDLAYHVFLQKEGLGDLYVAQKTARYFVVKGTPNLSFAWELKAKQAGFESLRLDEHNFYEAEEHDGVLESLYDYEVDTIYNELEALYETA